jgi:hypothetical protein
MKGTCKSPEVGTKLNILINTYWKFKIEDATTEGMGKCEESHHWKPGGQIKKPTH